MDGNKDESERCINIALKAKSLGDEEKAKKFLGKALRLYPTKRAADLLASLEKPTSNGEAPHSEGAESTKPRQRQNSHSKSREDENKENKVVDYTPEQLAAVKRINGCSDLYEVLELSKEFTDSELKKAYRKWALQMHPDKNKAPGATEAFKAVGKAYGILSDKDKKKQYDLYGPEMQPSRPSHDHDEYSHGFEGDISPEELFNMFFGGGFSSGHVHRRQHHQARRTYYTYREPQQSESGLTLFFQLAPILLLVVLSMLSSFLVSDAVFSLQRTDKYRVEKTTSNLRVTYFVKDEFRPEFKSELRRIERAVEEEYIGQLRSNCFRERNYKENMMWRARNYGDAKLYQRAVDMATPSCDNLQKVYS